MRAVHFLFYLAFVALPCCRASVPLSTELFALSYGTSMYPTELLATKQTGEYVRLSWLAYLIRTPNQLVLIDTGVGSTEVAMAFRIEGFLPLSEILSELKIKPEDITDIVITHSHLDHVGGLAFFPRARVHMQTSEFEYFLQTKRFADFASLIQEIQFEKRLILHPGNGSIGTGIDLIYTGGHTPGSQAVVMRSFFGRDTYFTGDECYFVDACKAGLPLPEKSRFDSVKNVEFLNLLRSKSLARILTLHDPDILKKNAAVTPHIFQLN